MKLIRMTKTMAGPDGVRVPGMKPFTVSDAEADGLVAAGAAEIIATISEQLTAAVLTPDLETAVAEPARETAVVAKPRKKAAK
jgi:hypothetical protein